jgi:WD40 repeat protein
LSFSPFGTYVALGYDYQVDVWNVTTRAKVSSSASATSFVDSLTFSASGAALIAGEDRCGRVLICAD